MEKGARCLLRYGAGALTLGLLMGATGCIRPLDRNGYEIMGEIALEMPKRYDFNQTLRLLYAEDVDIVLGRLSHNEEGLLVFTVQESLAGKLENGEVHSLELPPYLIAEGREAKLLDIPAPEDATSILLFLREEGGSYRPLLDAELWLMVDDVGTITTESDSIILLSQARFEIEKIREEISLPADFLYLEEMETLVQQSNYVFIGSFQGIRDLGQRKFDIYSASMRRSVSGDSKLYTLNVERVLKGDFPDHAEEMIVCDAPDVMLQNTIYYKSGQSVTYLRDDVPEISLESGSSYLFFLVDPPLNMQSAPKYFVNPIQGFVPITGDVTAPLFCNSVFVDQMYLDDVTSVIEGIVQGNAGSFEYDPNDQQNRADFEYDPNAQ